MDLDRFKQQNAAESETAAVSGDKDPE